MWLMREILGVRPLEPGFQKLRIQPHFADLEWAKGVVPTLRGNICVEWKRVDYGKINMAFDIPNGIEETEIVLDNLSQAVLKF